MVDLGEEKTSLRKCFLPVYKEKKKSKKLRRFALLFGIAFLLVMLLCAFEGNIKNLPCRFVVFIRNVIVNIVAGEFPDLSVV